MHAICQDDGAATHLGVPAKDGNVCIRHLYRPLASSSPENACGQAAKPPELNQPPNSDNAPPRARRKGDALDFSRTNAVSTVLGEETPEDGIKHLANQRDGLTTVEGIQGLPSKHLNRKPEKKAFGYVCFSNHPTFKSTGSRNAGSEIE